MKSSNGQKRSTWVADFETTTREDDCRVWGWGLVCVDTIDNVEVVEVGTTIELFMTRICQENSIIYFHNLAFDGSFILDWLLRQGFTHTTNRTVRQGEFSTLIAESRAFYSMQVTWRNGKTTEFRDSLKKLPMSVARIAESFKLEVAKGEIDYDLERPVGWVITPEEREYISLDVLIVAKALKVTLDAGMTKLTVGADSLAEYKLSLNGGKRQKTDMFLRVFPVMNPSIDAEIRKSYRGGFTYLDPRFRAKRVGKGATYDVNSLYPSVMYDRLLPYGEPYYIDGPPEPSEEFPLFIAAMTVVAKVKRNHIPCIQIKGSSKFAETEYLRDIKEPTTIMMTSIDLELWEEQYDLTILSYEGTWMFSGIEGVFKPYIDKWMEVKENSEGGMREIAKLHLNSLYGKFATNPNVTGRVPVMEDNVVRLKIGKEETRSPVYTAMGSFITAYARAVTVRAAQANYKHFAYADTDSLHLLTQEPPVGIEVHPSRLGAWKKEYEFSAAFFARAKCYTEHTEKGYVTRIAGMPHGISTQITLDDYVHGKTFPGKLLPKRVPGGTVLTNVNFTLNL